MQVLNSMVKESVQFCIMHLLSRRSSGTFNLLNQINVHVLDLAVVLNLSVFLKLFADDKLL